MIFQINKVVKQEKETAYNLLIDFFVQSYKFNKLQNNIDFN